MCLYVNYKKVLYTVQSFNLLSHNMVSIQTAFLNLKIMLFVLWRVGM